MHVLYLALLCLLLHPAHPAPNTTAKAPADAEGLGKGFLDYFLGNGPKFCKCLCGRANPAAGARILGGQQLHSYEYPWLVIVNIQAITTATGTLLNDRYVLTSASQVLGLTPYDVKVTVGKYDRCYSDTTSANHSISSILIHPEYDPLARGSDLALLRLSNTLTTDRWASPICLPKPGYDYQSQVVQMVGWGEGPTLEGATVATCLPRKVTLPVLSSRDCYSSAGTPGLVTSDKGCAGTGGTASLICSTDSGGPVQFPGLDGFYELVGVLTDTNVCSAIVSGSGVSLYTRLNAHFSWLFQNTRDSCYCAK